MGKLLNALLSGGAKSDLKRYRKVAERAGDFEDAIHALDDDALRAKTKGFRERLANGESLRSMEPEAFAVVREAGVRNTGKRLYDVQLMAASALVDGHIAELNTGEGKATSVGTYVPTPFGWRKAGDIRVGDLLFGRDGKPTMVVGVYPQGELERYRITFEDGREVICAGNHRWGVYTLFTDNPRCKTEFLVKTTEQMYKAGIRSKGVNGAHRFYKYKVPLTAPVEYQEADLPVDPYILGAFLGNGCKNATRKLEMSSGNAFVPEKVAARLEDALGRHVRANREHAGNYSWDFRYDDGKSVHAIDLSPALVTLLTGTYSYDKYVPKEYLTASVEQRLELLRGMLDTDGHIDDTDRHRVQYSTTSPRLRDAVRELAWSLGFKATVHRRPAETQRHASHDEWQVHILCDNTDKPLLFTEPTRATNAALALEAGPQTKKRLDRLAITSIELLEGTEEMVCFQVDAPDHLFLCGDYVVTHNTLAAAPAAYLMALSGEGAHVVTVNDYLAGRDAADVGRIHRALGLTVGLVQNMTPGPDRRLAYMADVTYGTNTEFGFDYLRDNMALSTANQVQRGHHFAIVDEADSILIDEARTPLIIAGDGAPEAKAYVDFAHAVATLDPKTDVEVDEARRTVVTTDQGLAKVERQIGGHVFADASGTMANHLQQALKARFLFQRDRDYIVDTQGQVQIVDEFTGRVLEGRRYSEGLHQAIEAKEGVKVNEESRTVASITLQNYFRMYDVLAGMTGTAMTAEAELRETYGTTVTAIPPNVPSVRKDDPDRIYMTENAKWHAVVADVKARHEKGQPCLVGTTSVEASESLSRRLSRAGVRHNVLNAKQNAREAEVVAEAGRLGAVTVATNMAGRGTDILLGGNPEMLAVEEERMRGYTDDTGENPAPADVASAILDETRRRCATERDEVVAAGGLAVIGTERHEARRIDDQLRGRAGRQGDPGETVFYVSLEDDLMRKFGENMSDVARGAVSTTMRNAVRGDESQPLQSKAISKQIERAQQRVEDANYAIRKNVVEYDDVVSRQRESVYGSRQRLLESDDPTVVETVTEMAGRAEDRARDANDDEGYASWTEAMTGDAAKPLRAAMAAENEYLGDFAAQVERDVALRVTDARWTDYLSDMEGLKNAIGLRGYGQRDPLVEYRQEARRAFDQLQASIDEGTARTVVRVRLQRTDDTPPRPQNRAERRRQAKLAKREARRLGA